MRNYNKDKLTYDYLNKIFNEVQGEIVCSIQNLKAKQFNILEKYMLYKKISTLHNFLQATLENSIISEQVINNLKEDYKQNFLQNLQKLDAKVQSEITSLKTQQSTDIEITDNAKLYLCLKNWKDILHNHYNKEILTIKNSITHQVQSFFKEKLPNFEGSLQELFSIYILSEIDLIDVKHIAKFVHINYYNFLTALYGGKNMGLAILYNHNISIPQTFCVNLISAIKNDIDISFLNKFNKYAIRSSATVEDNQNQSFAGMFDSVLNVDYLDIKKAITSVVDSVNSSRVKEYVKHFHTCNPQMAIVVQEFKNADFAGVWLGTGLDTGFLEWTEGVGDKLVSGKVIPHSEKWGGGGIECCLKVNNKPVAEECIKIQKLIGKECDLEFCIKNNKLFFLQCRPITKKIDQEAKNVLTEGSIFITGIPASSGSVTGKPVYVESIENNNFKEGQILLVDFTEPDWLPLIIKSKGIISAEGGMLSHTSIIARELGLPCIVGIGYENLEKIKNKQSITLDGTRGVIKE